MKTKPPTPTAAQQIPRKALQQLARDVLMGNIDGYLVGMVPPPEPVNANSSICFHSLQLGEVVYFSFY